MHPYFNINYESDKAEVDRRIEQQVKSGKPGYICDSGYVPLYLGEWKRKRAGNR